MRAFGAQVLAMAVAACAWLPLCAAELPAKLGVYNLPASVANAVDLPEDAPRIYYVAPVSAAGKAGLKPGDLITSFNGTAIKTFQELVDRIGEASAGETVELGYTRGDKAAVAKVTLSAFAGELTHEAYDATLEYLNELRKDHDDPILRQEIVTNLWQANHRNEALQQLEKDLQAYPEDTQMLAVFLEYLQKTGHYSRYVEESIRVAKLYPANDAFQAHKIDALLSVGRLEDAETAAVDLCKEASKSGFSWTAGRALEFWIISRMRQGKPLAGPTVPPEIANGPWNSESLNVMRYWRDKLRSSQPYKVETTKGSATLPFDKEKVLLGIVPNQMHGIKIRVNGVEVPLAIVDTGASHTLLSTATAEAANVEIGSSARRASGSLAFTARPGFVKEMQIGNLIIRNVPISVGNPPPLVMTKAKAALGVDLMHHIRFTIDYLNDRVHVAPASTPAEKLDGKATWDLPLWTFADHTLSRVQTDSGTFARALIDSGNFAQTLVWPVWASDNIVNHPGSLPLFVYAFTEPRRELSGLSLAGRSLPSWPVMDMPSVTLDGVDLLDLLMGHDLLSQYKVTIDMQARHLRLESPGDEVQPPKAIKPRGPFGL